jgi:HAD superfamily hydrolase (TIGR01509 family)
MRLGVVFDLDETLVDRRRSLDIYARELWSAFEGHARVDQIRFVELFHELDGYGRVPRDEFFTNVSRQAFTQIYPEAIAAHFQETAWLRPSLFDRVIDVIELLKSRDFAIGVVTNGGTASQSAKILNSGLARHLDAWVISEEFGSRKPDPAIFAEITRRLNLDIEASWFIGDDPVSDVWGPSQFGFQAAWLERYLPWPDCYERCYRHRVDHVLEFAEALLGRASM